MKKKVISVVGIGMVLFLILSGGIALANKSAVSIEAPQSVAKGSEITLRVTVTHNANNFLHYTKWVQIIINGKEVARWDYTLGNRPEGATFTKEIKYVVNEEIEVRAEAYCNLHGSAGPAIVKVLVKE
ncbi:MAG: desulfoferrodoxin family protein [Thermodesulfobacteriota bacterium]